MAGLFDELDKKDNFNQLRVDLLSRFYPFSNEELIEFQHSINFGESHLMSNPHITWDKTLVEELKENIEWSGVRKIKDIAIDVDFIGMYESYLDFSSLRFSKCIRWSEELITQYGDRFEWSRWPGYKEPLSDIDNVRKLKDKLDWKRISRGSNLVSDQNVIDEFSDLWDWEQLSQNSNLPLSVEFIQKYKDHLNFDRLSINPASIDLIRQYPKSKSWNWNLVVMNPAIQYNEESFDFFYSYFKRDYIARYINSKFLQKFSLNSFLKIVFRSSLIEKEYFFRDCFYNSFPWEEISKGDSVSIPLDIIERFKDKLDFKSSSFLRANRSNLTTDFIEQNFDLFDPSVYSFYSLELTQKLLMDYGDLVVWRSVADCDKLDWTESFILENFEKLNLYRLSLNQGVYDILIQDALTKNDILELLRNQ
jgi:hypothetical protein